MQPRDYYRGRNFPPAITVDGGKLMMSFTDFGGQIRPGPGKITISDSTFTGPNGLIFTLDILLPKSAAGRKADPCSFTNSQMQITDTYLGLQNCSLPTQSTQVLRGYVRLGRHQHG